MKKTLEIMMHEIVTLVTRFSFWFALLGVPLISVVLLLGVTWLNNSQGVDPSAPTPGEQLGLRQPDDLRPVGYVDPGGLIRKFPQGQPPADMIAYASEVEADQALRDGTIRAYIAIDPDYVNTGILTVFTPDFNPMNAGEGMGQLGDILEYNMLAVDDSAAAAIVQPLEQVEEVNLSPRPETVRDRDEGAAFVLPYVTMMLFYMAILGSAGLLLNSVSKEKENRIIEVLMSSVTPRQLLYGKIIGLGIVGLLQTMVWAGTAYGLMQAQIGNFTVPAEFQLDPSILVWGALFFVFGFLVYASLMAGIGALVPSLREGSQATILVVLPMIVPIMLISALIQFPDGPLAVGLSLFPFTSPTTMMLRLAATDVPVWQILLALGLLAVTSLLVIRAVAGLFRAQVLLSGQSFNIKRFALALLGR